MPASYIQLPADSTGKKLAARQLVIGADTVQRQHVELGMTAPQVTSVTSASLAAGASATLDSAQLTANMTGRLWGVRVVCAALFKAEVYTVMNGVPSAIKGLGISHGGHWEFRPPHPSFLTVPASATAGLDGFRVLVTNLGVVDASDVSCLFFFDEEVSGEEIPLADPVILEDFSNLRTGAGLPNPESPPQPVWYPQIGFNTPTVSSSTLTATVADGTQPQLYFRSIDNFGWYFLRQWIESGGPWIDNTYNRLRFQAKQTGGQTLSTDGHHSTEFGTYLHNWQSAAGPLTSGSDDNNWHFYHFLDIPSDGLWYTIIIDTFVDHQRGDAGSAEHTDFEYPDPSGTLSAGNVNKKYFDLMSAFYWHNPGGGSTGSLQLRQFSFFSEDNSSVPLAQVRSVNGAFNPATNEVFLGWQRRKDESAKEYTVRYAFAPITTFASATLSGTFNAPDTDDYNGVHHTITDAAFASHSYVWVAVQPTGSALFRQWWVPLS